jgi:hypothetical protein
LHVLSDNRGSRVSATSGPVLPAGSGRELTHQRVEHVLRAKAVVRELRHREELWLDDLALDLGDHAETLRKTIGFLVEGGVVEKGHGTYEGKRRGTLHLRPDMGILAGVEVTGRTASAVLTRRDFSEP